MKNAAGACAQSCVGWCLSLPRFLPRAPKHSGSIKSSRVGGTDGAGAGSTPRALGPKKWGDASSQKGKRCPRAAPLDAAVPIPQRAARRVCLGPTGVGRRPRHRHTAPLSPNTHVRGAARRRGRRHRPRAARGDGRGAAEGGQHVGGCVASDAGDGRAETGQKHARECEKTLFAKTAWRLPHCGPAPHASHARLTLAVVYTRRSVREQAHRAA